MFEAPANKDSRTRLHHKHVLYGMCLARGLLKVFIYDLLRGAAHDAGFINKHSLFFVYQMSINH